MGAERYISIKEKIGARDGKDACKDIPKRGLAWNWIVILMKLEIW